eukprot:5286536-Amphidinium_carterae.1
MPCGAVGTRTCRAVPPPLMDPHFLMMDRSVLSMSCFCLWACCFAGWGATLCASRDLNHLFHKV